MGCSHSLPTVDTHAKLLKPVMRMKPPILTSLILDERQKNILKESWEIFRPKKVAIGRKMFINLFKIHPEMQNLFPEFRDGCSVENIKDTRFLNGHAKRLMVALENAVYSLDDPYTNYGYIEELGRRHKTRKIKERYFDRMGAALVVTLQELYPEKWNAELERAWQTLFQITSRIMMYGVSSN